VSPSPQPDSALGVDFGITDSAVARAGDGAARLATFETSNGPTSTFPSILYFERPREESVIRLTSSAGPAAIERYLHAKEKGSPACSRSGTRSSR